MSSTAASVTTSESSRVDGARLGLTLGLGLVAGAITAWAVARSTVLFDPETTGLLRGLYVVSYVGVAAYTWRRRPDSRLAPLLAGVGFLYAATSLNASSDELSFTIGMVVWAAFLVYLAYVYLAFPTGGLETRLERLYIAAFGLVTALLWLLILAFAERLPPGGPFAYCGDRCPQNAFRFVDGREGLGEAIAITFTAAFTVSVVFLALLLVAKLRSLSHLRRRRIEPLCYLFIGTIAAIVLHTVVTPAYPGTRDVLRAIEAVFALAAPYAILGGQIRGNAFAARSLGRLVARFAGEPVSSGRIEAMMRETLGDPTLTLALWSPDRQAYLGADGRPVALPPAGGDRAVTPVVHGAEPVAALVHDPALDVDADVVDWIVSTSLMLLENARLVEELRASRARIVDAGARERIRLERDLHDGAQQRLMAIQVKLALAHDLAPADGELATHLTEIGEDAASAVDELRTLAHGLYPAVLRERGLADAFRAFARTARIPVRVVDHGVGRLWATTERAVYFCCTEAVQNAFKHAGADAEVTITLELRGSEVSFSVTDDGVGFDPEHHQGGLGLVNMSDRVGGVGGELRIQSSPRTGTTVRGIVPMGRAPTPAGVVG
jgi:signal transduction histidine kinase